MLTETFRRMTDDQTRYVTDAQTDEEFARRLAEVERQNGPAAPQTSETDSAEDRAHRAALRAAQRAEERQKRRAEAVQLPAAGLVFPHTKGNPSLPQHNTHWQRRAGSRTWHTETAPGTLEYREWQRTFEALAG